MTPQIVLILGIVVGAETASDRALVSRLLASVGWIHAGSEGVGTAWIVDVEKKRLITNHHVAGTANSVEVLFPECRDGKLVVDRAEYLLEFRRLRIEGRVLRRDPSRDLALIEVSSLPANARPIPLAENT